MTHPVTHLGVRSPHLVARPVARVVVLSRQSLEVGLALVFPLLGLWKCSTAIRADGRDPHHMKERSMGLGTILVIILILMLVGVLPTWPHSREWGYAPSGIVGLLVVIVLVLFLLGRI